MLDHLPPEFKAFILAVAPVALGFIANNVIPQLQDKNPLAAYVVGAVVTLLLGYVTPVTRQFGMFQQKRAS